MERRSVHFDCGVPVDLSPAGDACLCPDLSGRGDWKQLEPLAQTDALGDGCNHPAAGGAAAFALIIADLSSTSTNEDTTFNSSLSASTNYNSDIAYNISSEPTNGQASVTSSGAFTYIPNQDYYGQDTFAIRVTATRKDSSGQTIGTPLSKTQTIDMTINPVNDAPILTLVDNDFSGYGDTNIVFDD